MGTYYSSYLRSIRSCKGIFLGIVSNIFNTMYDGIVITAISYTLCILFALLSIYRLGIIKPTENFKLGVASTKNSTNLLLMIQDFPAVIK